MIYKRCVKCGMEKLLGETECPKCGVIYAKAEAKKEREAKEAEGSAKAERGAESASKASTNTKIKPCPACGGKTSSDALTCPHCGHPLYESPEPEPDATVSLCPACNENITPEAQTCPHCGHPLQQSDEEFVQCYSCQNFVKKGTDTCPHCKAMGAGFSRFGKGLGCLGIILVIVCLIVFKVSTETTSHSLSRSEKKETAWYVDGTLHKSTVREWKAATPRNKLATASDWAVYVPKIKNIVTKSGDVDTAKPYAYALVRCIDKAVEGDYMDHQPTSDMAAACIGFMGWHR